MDTKNATTTPVTSVKISAGVKCETKFYKFQKARAKHDRNRQEKGKLCCYVLEVPTRIPPIIVEPERDVPGITEST